MKRCLLIAICLMVTNIGATSPEVKKNDLQLIMNELMKNTQTLSHAILIQDFEQIELAAASIADHPKPSSQTLNQIKQTLNKEMPLFKQYDNTVHQAALTITSLVKAKDIQQITTEYLRMYQGCQSCHADYKERISIALKDK
ncbi:MAG: cytochrome c [Kangiellaceae bacterium]|jgi:cytochrome c556